MTLELINPEGLSSPLSYTHVVVATGSQLVFVAGQVADDADGNLVGDDDLAAQARQAFANVGRALAAVGARPDHVAKLTIYVVGHRLEYLPVISEARIAVFGEHSRHSLMGGIRIAGTELARADRRRRDELVHRFSVQAGGWSESIDHLNAFAANRTAFLSEAVGLDATRDVRLDEWLERVGQLADAEPNEFGKEGSFEALVRWFAAG